MKPKSSVWRYFNKLIDKENLTAYTCRYCAARYKCAHATRLRDHLIKCAACPINVKALFNRKKRTKNVHLNYQTHQLMKQHQVIIYALFYYNFHILGVEELCHSGTTYRPSRFLSMLSPNRSSYQPNPARSVM